MWVGVDPSRIGMPCHERVRYASRCYGVNSNRDNNLVNYPRMLASPWANLDFGTNSRDKG